MGLSQLFQLSAENFGALQHLADILHLFQHRNKNQHRRSVWWRHFSVNKKSLDRLVLDLFMLQEVPTSHLARTKKKATDGAVRVHLEQSVKLWRDVLVPKWQHAFSQLAADGRFAVLGLVLLSVLAESCRLVGITAAFEDLGQNEIEQVLEQFGTEWQPNHAGARTSDEDVGEAIVRRAEVGASAASDSTEQPTVTAHQENGLNERPPAAGKITNRAAAKRPASKIITGIKKKKKAKKGNAIDDLFNGFG